MSEISAFGILKQLRKLASSHGTRWSVGIVLASGVTFAACSDAASTSPATSIAQGSHTAAAPSPTSGPRYTLSENDVCGYRIRPSASDPNQPMPPVTLQKGSSMQWVAEYETCQPPVRWNPAVSSWTSSNTSVATVSPSTSDYVTVTGVGNGTANITGVVLSRSATASVTVYTPQPVPPPDPPSYLDIANRSSDHANVQVVWGAPQFGSSPFGYNVYRLNASTGNYDLVAGYVTSLTWTDPNRTVSTSGCGHTGVYVVKAFNSTGESSGLSTGVCVY